jgi:ketosteroid isomerase-like protein
MSAMEVGRKLVALCQEGKNLEALDTLYDKDAESIEAMGMPEMPAEMKGLDALRKKNQWWFANNEVHSGSARGPFPNGDRFAVIFNYDVTPKSGPMAGRRMQMEEVGLYTVKGGKIVREEFFYAMG